MCKSKKKILLSPQGNFAGQYMLLLNDNLSYDFNKKVQNKCAYSLIAIQKKYIILKSFQGF